MTRDAPPRQVSSPADAGAATVVFTRGDASVELRRTMEPTGAWRLEVHGPGATLTTHICPALEGCDRLQEQLEGGLLADGYERAPQPERRIAPERRRHPRGPGRRRNH